MKAIKRFVKTLANTVGLDIRRASQSHHAPARPLKEITLASREDLLRPNQDSHDRLPFTIQLSTAYGQMLVNRHDINQTNSLVKTGKGLGHSEVVLLGELLRTAGKAGAVVLDVGANVGVFTLGLLPYIGPNGKVYSFEPQRVIFNLLAGSVAINSVTNVYLYNMAVGDHVGKIAIPQFDYWHPLNFGSIEFGSEQKEPLTQPRGFDPSHEEHVPIITIDEMAIPRVDLMKIDVEGMETFALKGAAKTIERDRPILFVEHLKSDKDALRRQIKDFGYVVYHYDNDYLCLPPEIDKAVTIDATTCNDSDK